MKVVICYTQHKESMLWSYHKEELQRIQSQAQNEVRKVSYKFLKMLCRGCFPYWSNLYKYVEAVIAQNRAWTSNNWIYTWNVSFVQENQRALLQVMGQVDQEVNSKKVLYTHEFDILYITLLGKTYCIH
jgi:hypothetical protein